MARRVIVIQPGVEGMVRDRPAYALKPREAAELIDAIWPNAVTKQRFGWAYENVVDDISSGDLIAVMRAKFVLTQMTRTMISDDAGHIRYQDHGSTATVVTVDGPTAGEWSPRCMYRDEVIWCANDGVSPLIRYSGAMSFTQTANPATWTTKRSTLDLTSGSFVSGLQKGAYVAVATTQGTSYRTPPICVRVMEKMSTTSVSLEGIQAGSTLATGSPHPVPLPYGRAYPCVPVYNTGTVTVSSNVANGIGTMWDGSTYAYQPGDSMLLYEGDALVTHNVIGSVLSSAQIQLTHANIANPVRYAITRAMPFKDACVYANSLYGVGVKEFPSRVYINRPGQQLGLPPGAIEPFDPTAAPTFTRDDYFTLLSIDVPSSHDGDDIVGITPSTSGVMVFKDSSVYVITGSYPSLSVSPLISGIGALSRESIANADGRIFFAGRQGIFMWESGRLTDLTAGKIGDEWRLYANRLVSWCSVGVAHGTLFVSLVASGVTKSWALKLSTGAWTTMTNMVSRCMSRPSVPGEVEALLATLHNRKRVVDLSPTVRGTKIDLPRSGPVTLQPAAPNDGDGHSPQLSITTGNALVSKDGIEGQSTILDMQVHVKLYDTGDPGASKMSVDIKVSGAMGDELPVTYGQGSIDSANSDNEMRVEYPYLGYRGRRFQVKMDMWQVSDTLKSAEVPQIVITARDHRSRI